MSEVVQFFASCVADEEGREIRLVNAVDRDQVVPRGDEIVVADIDLVEESRQIAVLARLFAGVGCTIVFAT